LLATLLTKDTANATAAQVADRIEALGGSFSPFAGNNMLGVALEVLTSDVGDALELLGDAVLRPRFDRGTFEREREAQSAALQQDADDVVTYGRKRVRRLFFGEHPLALDAQGDLPGLASLTPTSVRSHYERLLVAGNAVLVAAGDFDPAKLGSRLDRLLRVLPRREAPAASPRFVGPAPTAFVEHQPREQAVVFQAFPGPGLLEPDCDLSDVADELFSGMASRLFERVREEKGLAYFVRSSRVVGTDAGMFFFFAGTAPRHAREVLTEIEAEIRRVAESGVDAAELKRCQERLKVARRQAHQTTSNRALHAALHTLVGLPVNDASGYDSRIDAVTIDDLAAFARRRLAPEQRVQLVVGPEGMGGMAP
jgi:zinc protease